MEIAGEISGEIVAANAESVDHEGPHVVDGRVVYAQGTQKNLDALVKAGLMGICLTRRYNGLKQFMNLQVKSKKINIFQEYVLVKQWQWT